MQTHATSVVIVIFAVGLSQRTLHSQTISEDIWHSVSWYVLPQQISAVDELRDFIATQPPMPYSMKAHRARLDRIWNYAVYTCNGNVETALSISSVATVPYYTFPAYVPLLGFSIRIPVTTESQRNFERRYENLPTLLFPDTPGGGDRDKLPHFFGSAYIQFRSRSPFLTGFIGEFVEQLETLFKLQGAHDHRDIEVNYRGIAFAQALRNGQNAKPSDFFNVVLSRRLMNTHER